MFNTWVTWPTLRLHPDGPIAPQENRGTDAVESAAQIIDYIIDFELLYRSLVIAEFSFGDLVATTSGRHFDEFKAKLLQMLSARVAKFDDSGVELSVSATKFDLFFAQLELPAFLECEYNIYQEIGVSEWNNAVVCC